MLILDNEALLEDVFVAPNLEGLVRLFRDFLMQKASDSSVKFKFRFFEKLTEILFIFLESNQVVLSEFLGNELVNLWGKYKKYKNHKSYISFKLTSSAKLINLGVFHLDCLGLVQRFTSVKYRRQALELAILLLTKPFHDQIKSKIACNGKIINAILEIMCKEKGK